MKLSGVLASMLTSAVALSSADAADMYTAPAGVSYKDTPYVALDWAGFYAGVNGGYGWANNKQEVDPFFSGKSPAFGGLSPSGGFAGGQIGYNWQGIWNPNLVLGVEADIQGAGINASATHTGSVTVAIPPIPPFTLTKTANFKSDLDYFGTARGRIGYAFDRALLYFTGGFAYGGLKKSSNDYGSQSFDGAATGYVLGGGLEYKINPVWSVKAEYQYLNFGKNDMCGGGSCFSDANNAGSQKSDDYHTVRVGINYHFNDYIPLK